MSNKKEKYQKAYYDLVDRVWKPFKDSMTEEEFKEFRDGHTTDEFLDDYEYTFEEEVGYWLDSGDRAYKEYMCNFGQSWYDPKVANELKEICG